ncbi:SGNH/GDSL hydrolase family protein [Candidatus Saganbacteria bacterium]|uniref:SGNH/GDSL hydrolase family protein n=1 Tax=Candidatus Saganbacteria bacterium TaxID=2575572 RepID=A0A9D6YXN2_UNCSA|nr:SGNH/GDSL hydrolase family protein [Candidatus Saganbacteria bacterium]
MKSSQNKFFASLGVLLWIAAAGVLAGFGVEPDKAVSFHADSDTAKWDQYWKQGNDSAKLENSAGTLPTVLPGPMDAWGGGKPHGVELIIAAAPGKYELVVTFHETHEKFPPSLTIIQSGAQVWRGKLAAGGGKPGPYTAVFEKGTIRVPVSIAAGKNSIEIRNTGGSWAAPAEIYIFKGRTINADKLLHRLFSDPKAVFFTALPALMGLILFRAPSNGFRIAAAEAGIVAASFAVTAACIELGYRVYLKNRTEIKPATAHGAAFEKGRNFSLMDMLEPTGGFDLPYLLKPSLDGFFYGKHVKTNSRGFRGPEITVEKPAGVLRVAGLGDSVLFGWGVDYEQTMLYRLSELLTGGGGNIELINTAVPGYNTAVESAVYEKVARKFSPDIVVLLFVENDFYYPHIMAEPVSLLAVNKSYLAGALAGYFGARWGGAGVATENWMTSAEFEAKKDASKGDAGKTVAAISQGYEATTGKKAVENLIRRLGAMIRADKAIGVFVWPPFNVYPSQPKYDYPDLDERGHYEQVAREAGFLVPAMRQMFLDYVADHKAYCQGDILWLNENDSHPRPDAYEMMARAVFKSLQESGAPVKPGTK